MSCYVYELIEYLFLVLYVIMCVYQYVQVFENKSRRESAFDKV